ncbi:Solute carrier family 2, facilitated glucose transporter member 3 [Thelohanellus kitauei]|uniref:Solute carrier family 2, facilitated glucose transporter member 3 n=1 Tax=Thelohanellus kitauei TaxID=669202 RepID=A0A0C2J325_THEKT|nr:Solute carrier family 2, facilitated glucose transporter member 3 [Thelohanellus kitauei]
MSELPFIQECDSLTDESDLRRNSHASFFSLNWLAFGYAIAYCSDGEYMYLRMGIMDRFSAGTYAASLAIGGLVGSLLMGFLLKGLMSYKNCQILSCVITVLGWYFHCLVILLEDDKHNTALMVLNFSRFMIGIACGISVHVVPICCSMASSTRARHIFGLFPPLSFNFGFFLCYIYGWAVIKMDVIALGPSLANTSIPVSIHQRGITYYPLLGIAISGAGLLFTILFDESYVVRDQDTLVTNRRFDPFIGQTTTFRDRIAEQCRLLRKPYILKELALCNILAIQQMIGINVIIFNATNLFQPFFQSKSSDPSSPALIGVMIGFVYLLSIFVVCFLTQKYSRTSVLQTGSVVMAFCHFVLALCYLYDQIHSIITPIVCLIFVAAFCCSWGPFPWLVISEVFDIRIRNFGMTLSSSLMWFSMFMMTMLYAPIVSWINASGVFFLLLAFTIISFIYTYLFVPETKYLTLEEIQSYFKEL